MREKTVDDSSCSMLSQIHMKHEIINNKSRCSRPRKEQVTLFTYDDFVGIKVGTEMECIVPTTYPR